MKKSLLLGTLLTLVFAIGSPFISQAFSMNGKEGDAKNNAKVSSATTDSESSSAKMRQDVETKRAEIEAKLSIRHAAIHEKLTGKRAASCEKKQAHINQVIDNRVSTAYKHLEHFKDIQNKLDDFVESKALVVENGTALKLILNDAQAAAQAAIDSASATTFTCGGADSTAPGKLVTEQVAAQKQALKDYRDAIKEYAVAIKGSLATTTMESDGARR